MATHSAQQPSSVPTPLEQLVASACAVLQQAVDFVSSTVKSDEQLLYASTALPGSTIGKHIRHARDHFALLLDTIMAGKPYILSYDTRSRNTPMESSRQATLEALQDTITRLSSLHVEDTDAEITLNAVTPHAQILKSSIGRELWFVSLHAVHHWSMVRVVAHEQGLAVEPELGVAPSTLLYREHHAQVETQKSKI